MFNAKIFEPTNSEEGLLRDRKQEIYHAMHRDDALDREHGYKLIKHAIAMANTARMLGKSTYLLFGVTNDGKIVGLETQLQREFSTDFQNGTWSDRLCNHFVNFLRDKVKPFFNCWEFKCGRVRDKNSVEQPVAYLMFRPTNHDTPFHVTADIPKFTLKQNDCWIRFGESSREVAIEEIAPDDDRFKFAYAKVPYVLPSLWKSYYEHLGSNQELNEAMEIPGYQDLFAETGEQLQSVVEGSLSQEDSKALVISGAAGIGKTLFSRRLVSQIASDGVAECEISLQLERFTPPSIYVPIYLKLRSRQWRGDDDLADLIISEATGNNRIWHRDSPRPTKLKALFDRPDIKWLICLDGFDEVWTVNDRSVLLDKLRRFVAQTSNVKIIVTTRPRFTSLVTMLDAACVTVSPLSEQQVRSYLQAYGDIDVIDEAIDYLRTPTNSDLWTLCALPMNLDAAAQILVGRPARSLRNDRGDNGSQTVNLRPAAPLSEAPAFEEIRVSDAADLVDTKDIVLNEPLTTDAANADTTIHFEPTDVGIKTGVVVDQIYRQVWEREERRRESEISQPVEFRLLWDRLSGFAFEKAASNGVFSAERVSKALSHVMAPYWLASLGILKEVEEHMSDYRFFTECTHAYFAVKHVASGECAERECKTILREVQRLQESRYLQIVRIAMDLGIPIVAV